MTIYLELDSPGWRVAGVGCTRSTLLIMAWAHQTPCAANRTFIQRAEAYLNLGPLGFLLMVSPCPLPASAIGIDPDDHSLLQPQVLASLPSDPSSFHAHRVEPPYTPGCEYLLGTLAELQPGCAWRPHSFLSFAVPFDPTCVSTRIGVHSFLCVRMCVLTHMGVCTCSCLYALVHIGVCTHSCGSDSFTFLCT